KLRSTFIKIKKSEQLQNKLIDFCNITKTKYIKPILDVKTRWNSTHDMIEVGISLKNSLNLFWLSHENNKSISMLRLNENEWLLLEQICIFLKNFKIVSKAICGEKYVTLPIVVVAFNILISDID
ncbi:GSCOCG00010277001-RA-CDS, partial [Cotesia congregata]